MKTLKISLVLIIVAVLTISLVSKDGIDKKETKTENPAKLDLLAHGKKEHKMPPQG